MLRRREKERFVCSILSLENEVFCLFSCEKIDHRTVQKFRVSVAAISDLACVCLLLVSVGPPIFFNALALALG
jgi:hypothetical protein